MTEKKELTMLERFQKYAATKSEGTRVYNVLKRWFCKDELAVQDFEMVSVGFLLKIKGISRKAAKVVIDVVADFND